MADTRAQPSEALARSRANAPTERFGTVTGSPAEEHEHVAPTEGVPTARVPVLAVSELARRSDRPPHVAGEAHGEKALTGRYEEIHVGPYERERGGARAMPATVDAEMPSPEGEALEVPFRTGPTDRYGTVPGPEIVADVASAPEEDDPFDAPLPERHAAVNVPIAETVAGVARAEEPSRARGLFQRISLSTLGAIVPRRTSEPTMRLRDVRTPSRSRALLIALILSLLVLGGAILVRRLGNVAITPERPAQTEAITSDEPAIPPAPAPAVAAPEITEVSATPADEIVDPPHTAPATDVEAAIARAQAARRHGDLETAERELSSVLEADPSNGRALVGLTRLLEARSEWSRATVYATRLVHEHGDQPANHALLGEILTGAGDGPGARAAYERALELSPRYAPAREGLEALGE